jgi:uncharacterized membrane protein
MSSGNRPPTVIVRSGKLLCLYVGAKLLLMGLRIASQVMDGSWAEAIKKLNEDYPAFGYWIALVFLSISALEFGLLYFIVRKLRQRRNWARYVLLITFLFRSAYELAVACIAFKLHGVAVLPSTVIRAGLLAVYCYAVGLLFTKQARQWLT